MSLPKVSGLFRLTRDSELRYSNSGSAILKMGLACSEKFGEKESQLFIDATAFGKPAEILNTYAGAKGTQIFLSGKIQTESWEKDGQRQSKTTMVIEGFDFVSKPKGNGENNHSGYANGSDEMNTGANAPVSYEKKPMPQNLPEIDINEDEIPF